MEIATAVGGSILSVCFQGLFDRLSSIDLKKYVGQGQVLAQLKKWEKMLQRIYVVLEDAEEKQTADQSVEIWLSDLRDLAHDLEDIMDELATEVQRRKLEDKPVRPNDKVHKLLSAMCGGANLNLNTIKFNAEMVAKIEETSARLDEIIKQKDELHLAESNRRVSHVTERPPSTSLVNEAKVYGREEDKKAMLKLLNAETSDAQVSVISIVGMGGLGKTTLAQLVYNDPMLEFDLKAWVSVGEDFDVFRVTKTVLHQLGDGGGDNDLNLLQVKLKQNLSWKKFLVVLDDVWTQNYEQWTLFWGPFEAGAAQSRVIVTTRSQDVSLMMGATQAYSLKKLSHNECMSVFAQHALGANNFDDHLELKEIGEEIVKRCGGLPLAAKALGGILKGKPNPDLWKEVLSSEMWELPDNRNNILPALKLSYLHLPPQLKRCFSYCAILPKDREFDRNELVLLWMAEGFLYDKKKMKDSEGLGQNYFDDLLSRSFFQQSNDNKSKYIMHDLIVDLACFVSREVCLHMVGKLQNAKSYAKIRHSSFIPHFMNTFQRFQSFYEMKNLRTLLSWSRYVGRLL
ncbi:putative disease resistance RPP13-like protein 1 [Manihot esculenta]|uniref:putative disease resistance RPP13-like protein 1 n=1 Tax=Manihot esculenta TaxID=3983 RepID=UPI001CC57412|nr:putative disease resistance RPP13-like protein 1 [Manihot esculenta]